MDAMQAPRSGQWMPTWTAAVQLTEPENFPPVPFQESDTCFCNATLRQTLRVTSTSQYIRLSISNAFGSTELPVTAVTIGLPVTDPEYRSLAGSRAVRIDTLHTACFNGLPSVTVSPGAQATSDAINMAIEAGQILSVSVYLQQGQEGERITSHPGSRTYSWVARGDCTHAESMAASGMEWASVAHWYYLCRVEAWQPSTHGVFALLGDSVTDGRISTDNQNNRWPDRLFDRMQQDARLLERISMANLSIGGNRVLQDVVGPSLCSRLERDALNLPGLRYVLIFEGVNDIGTADLENVERVGDRLIQAYQQIIRQLHNVGIAVFGATIPPFDAPAAANQPYAHPARVATWRRVNGWIRTSGAFDAVVDMAAVLCSSKDSPRLRSQYDSGDSLHPNLDGFQAMADAFPLNLLVRFAEGVDVVDEFSTAQTRTAGIALQDTGGIVVPEYIEGMAE